jgi:hypothetical protein
MKHALTSLRKKPASTQPDLDAVWAEFPAEADLAKRAAASTQSAQHRRLIVSATAVLLAIAAAVFTWRGVSGGDASLRIESEPSGAAVRLDGELRGVTPLAINLPPGSYSVAIGDGPGAQERRITLGTAERASSYHVLAPAPAVATGTSANGTAAGRGSLAVTTEPAGGTVTVDDVNHGVAPVVVPNLTPGQHQLVVRNQGAVYRRTVVLTAGNTSTVVVSAAPATSAGWLSIRVPLALEVREGERLLGTTAVERIMLPTGTHQLEFSSAAAGFRATRSVRIDAGATTTLALDVPRVPVNVNAVPWGEVWIDDQRVGETPIGNHMLTLGDHRIEIRHPELGVKQLIVTVALGRANRIAVNMRER